MTRLVLCGLLLCQVVAAYATNISLQLANGLNVESTVYQASGSESILWLPSEEGHFLAHVSVAKRLRSLNIEVWIPYIYQANFAQPSLSTLNRINPWQIAEIIDKIQHHSPKRVWLVSSEAGAILALRGLRYWQQKYPDRNNVGGAILINPQLTYGTPPVGTDPDYLPIVEASNKPIALLLSENSVNYWHAQELIDQLSIQNTDIVRFTIPNTRYRFQRLRFATEKEERATYEVLPSLISQAIQRLKKFQRTTPMTAVEKLSPPKLTPNIDIPANLSPIALPYPVPAISINHYNRTEIYQTQKNLGKVQVITFWPAWCYACQIQLKHQNQLLAEFADDSVKILSIRLDKSTTTNNNLPPLSQQFFLADGQPNLIQRYNLRAPSTTLITDKRGQVRYSFHGLVNWQSSTIKTLIEQLLKES